MPLADRGIPRVLPTTSHGTLYCDGQEVRSGQLGDRLEVTCKESGLSEYYS